jgi:maltooligosyltrehalose trehalohydrolase
MVPNPQDLDTFGRSKLNWSELSLPAHAELLAWYRRLIQLRAEKVMHPRKSAEDSGKAVVTFNAEARWLNFSHKGVLAVFNFHQEPQRVHPPEGQWNLVLRSDSKATLPTDAMPGETTFIYIGG